MQSDLERQLNRLSERAEAISKRLEEITRSLDELGDILSGRMSDDEVKRRLDELRRAERH
jgi:hypothetical protein